MYCTGSSGNFIKIYFVAVVSSQQRARAQIEVLGSENKTATYLGRLACVVFQTGKSNKDHIEPCLRSASRRESDWQIF